MKALAAGRQEKITLKIIKILINTTQGSQFETYLDEEGIKDIAEVIKMDEALFEEGEAIETMVDAPSKKTLKDPDFL